MDMFQFREMMAREYDISDVDMSIFDRVAVVKFDYDEHGVVSGKCRLGLVFRHRDSESLILPGETWVCSLEQNTPRQFFGKAIMKVDAALLYGLTMEQLDGITDALWENQREDILALMEEKYRDQTEKEIEERVKAVSDEYESQLAELKDNISNLETKNDEYLMKLGESDDEINELKIRLKKAESVVIPRTVEQPKSEGSRQFKALRVSGNKVFSQEFRDGTYKILFSADGHSISMVPSEKGKAVCINGLMTVSGLDRYIPFLDSVAWDAMDEGNGNIELCVPAE